MMSLGKVEERTSAMREHSVGLDTQQHRESLMPTQLADIVESSQAERLATGFVFTEGPVWHPEGYWLFVDVRASLIYRLAPGGQPEIFREQSGGSSSVRVITGRSRAAKPMAHTLRLPSAWAGSASTGPMTW
jgi:hypothetical protein